jgi:hypothetical protein
MPFLPPLGPSVLEFPFEYDLTVCISPNPCDSLLIDSANHWKNLHRHMDYGQFASPFGTIYPPRSCDLLDF